MSNKIKVSTDALAKNESAEWLKKYAERLNLTYSELMAAAKELYLINLVNGANFWMHYQILTGKKLSICRNCNHLH